MSSFKGFVKLSRVSGTTNLWGSGHSHQHFIELTISSVTQLGDGVDPENVLPGGVHARVWMSAAQFSELITTMNVGHGVPCTVREVSGQTMPLPSSPTDSDFKRSVESAVASVKRSAEQFRERASGAGVEAILSKLSKRDVAVVSAIIRDATMHAEGNARFLLEQIAEGAEKASAKVKAEIASMAAFSGKSLEGGGGD